MNRNIVLDIARGLGILIICVLHLVYRPQDGFFDTLIRASTWLMIPFFFFMSGYVHKSERKIFPKVKTLFINATLYVTPLLLIGGAYCMYLRAYTIKDVIDAIVLTFLRPEFSWWFIGRSFQDNLIYDIISPVWFVWTMLFTLPVFHYINVWVNKNFSRLIIITVILLALSVLLYDYSDYFSWSLTLVPYYAAVMLWGKFAKDHEIIKRMPVSYVAAIVAAIIHFLLYKYFGDSSIFMNVVGKVGKWSVLFYFVQTFIGGYTLILLSMVFNKFDIATKVMSFIGRNSLLFMIMHRPFAVVFCDMMGTYIKSGEYWYVEFTPKVCVLSFIAFLLSIACCSIMVIIKTRVQERH